MNYIHQLTDLVDEETVDEVTVDEETVDEVTVDEENAALHRFLQF